MRRLGHIPYGRQSVSEEDIQAVVDVLRSDWLTTGPAVERFEEKICGYAGAAHGVAVNSGTAALHAAMAALDIGPGDEVIVPPMTFAASANCILYQGGTPVFADVEPDTLLLDPQSAAARITPRTKAVIGVDYAGQPCDWDALRALADRYGLALVADSCHALGATYRGRKVGTLADISVFSFHPVKHITTGEGGMAVTGDAALARRMRAFRNHGITTTAAQREKSGTWLYEMTGLGYNYRITDFQCALGASQLTRLDGWLKKRSQLARAYERALAGTPLRPLARRPDRQHAWHLYVIRTRQRNALFNHLRANGIGANVHYMPVHLHPYYREKGYAQGICPVAEAAWNEILTLPLWSGMEEGDVIHIADIINRAIA